MILTIIATLILFVWPALGPLDPVAGTLDRGSTRIQSIPAETAAPTAARDRGSDRRKRTALTAEGGSFGS